MRYIDLETWPRREHFEFFNAYSYPYFSLCANVDVTAFRAAIQQRDASVTVSIAYVLARAANTIPQFRQRIRGGQVVEHEVVHPGFTVLVDEDTFTFCMVTYYASFREFAARTAGHMAAVKEDPSLNVTEARDDWLFMTAIPWVSFTSFTHPMDVNALPSVPRMAWGKFFQEGGSWKMPLNVQGHHAVMDGLHMARFYAEVQELLHQAEATLEVG